MIGRLLTFFLVVSITQSTIAQNQVGVIELDVNDSTKTFINIKVYLDGEGDLEYYSFVTDSNFVEFYSVNISKESYNHVNPVDEGTTINAGLNFIQSDTTYINRHGDYYISAFDIKYLGFRYLKNEQYIYGYITINGIHATKCVTYVEEFGCLESKHIPVLAFEGFIVESGNENEIVTNEWGEPIITSVYTAFNLSQKVLVYPNPTNSKLTVESTVSQNYHLLNTSGNIVKEISSNSTVDLSILESGIYFLKSGKNSDVIKVIKSK